jgi:hypothetical protein
MGEQDEADRSGSTAQFRAFVDHSRRGEMTQPWTVSAPRHQVLKLSAVAVAVAALLGLVAYLVIG